MKSLKSFIVNHILMAGTTELTQRLTKRVAYVNKICFVTGVAAFVIGYLFYLKTDQLRILLPALLEGVLFTSVILMNARRKYRMAGFSMIIIHCLFAWYFGNLLAHEIYISLIVAFLIIASLLMYIRQFDKWFGVALSTTTFILLQFVDFSYIIPPLDLSQVDKLIIKVVSIPTFIGFIILTIQFFIKDVKIDQQRVKDFYESMMHEINGCLNSMLPISSMLSESAKNDPKQAEMALMIFSAAEQLKNLSRNVLQKASSEQGIAGDIVYESVKIMDLLTEVIGFNKYRATTKRKRLLYQLNDNVPVYFVIDHKKINSILTNLVSNAIKFGNPNSAIFLKVHIPEKNWIAISVENAGPEIPPANFQKIFDLYFTTSKDENRDGTGLGLSIVKNLTKALLGTISVQSANNLTIFTVTFPIDPIFVSKKRQSPKVFV